MKDEQYKNFIQKCHPELVAEAESFINGDTEEPTPKPKKRKKMDRSSWEYICRLMPKLKNLAHVRISGGGMGRMDGWYVYTVATVGCRKEKVGISIWAHDYKCGKHFTETIPLTSKEHYLEFYTRFGNASTSCYQSMTNLPGHICKDGYGNVYPTDIPHKRKEIYRYLGIEPKE